MKRNIWNKRLDPRNSNVDLLSIEEVYLTGKTIYNIKKQLPWLNECINLKKLQIESSRITKIEGLDKLTQLTHLFLTNNKMTKIKGLENLTQLSALLLTYNEITKIEGLENLTKLKKLHLNCNKIAEIEGLENLIQLNELTLTCNFITKIAGLNNLTQLTTLFLNYNLITKIEGLDGLDQLLSLCLNSNQITVVPNVLVYSPRLRHLTIGNNPIERFHPVIDNFLRNRMNARINDDAIVPYADSQSVHSANVQAFIRKNIVTLLENDTLVPFRTIEEVVDSVLIDSVLTDSTKKSIVEYASDKVNGIVALPGIRFADVLIPVWNRITNLQTENAETAVNVKRVLITSVQTLDHLRKLLHKSFMGNLLLTHVFCRNFRNFS